MSGPFRSLVLQAALAAVAACGGSSPAPVATLTVTPDRSDLLVGQTLQITAVATDTAGKAVSDGVSWRSSAPSVASVSGDGLVTALTVGVSTITAEAGGHTAFVVARVLAGQQVGPAGGRIAAGQAALEVPAGALAEPTPVGLDTVPVLPLDPMVVAGTGIRVVVDRALAQPAVLELSFAAGQAPVGVSADMLRVARLDGEAWREVASKVAGDGRVSAAIPGEGSYALRMAVPQAPCSAPEHRQFDFWLGVWNIHSPAGGGGHSEITRDAAGCLVFERFTEANTVGLSVNFYNPGDRRWHQTYVDNHGTRLLLSGTLIGGDMVLTTAPGPQMSRITWQLVGDEVRQLGESTSDGGNRWVVDFEGFYRRQG